MFLWTQENELCLKFRQSVFALTKVETQQLIQHVNFSSLSAYAKFLYKNQSLEKVMVCLKSSISDFYVKMLQFIRNIWLHHSRGILNAVLVSASFNKKNPNKQKTSKDVGSTPLGVRFFLGLDSYRTVIPTHFWVITAIFSKTEVRCFTLQPIPIVHSSKNYIFSNIEYASTKILFSLPL